MGDMSNLLHNATVDTLLERRSIRKFKSKPLGDDVIETLETVAQHAASSQFLNDWSAIRVTDPAAKKRLAEIGGQPYIATAPLLYVFVLDEHRNAAIAASKGVETASDEFTLMAAIVTLRRRMTQFWRFMRWRLPLIRSVLVA
ncbi:NADPH-dependent oxidoreductase [Bifidobacterium catenulatum]|nr:NADPH-dependent oxidoreductase [Bifidobacterium catenulatum]